ncbi:hypothetical protein HPP92_024746 [Vanilla planifolia]|uniref:Uncharacterized protein n=1 Tax=Vanilla planifolia TaxID=51239 RepID=A0A835U9J3_VANPL|nr:hypothetical protein HPP92_024746 [Vanilla planifolia]
MLRKRMIRNKENVCFALTARAGVEASRGCVGCRCVGGGDLRGDGRGFWGAEVEAEEPAAALVANGKLTFAVAGGDPVLLIWVGSQSPLLLQQVDWPPATVRMPDESRAETGYLR